MVPPRLARKMSVMSVEPPARGAPGGIAAERVHRPGSRRLGGVEATGASPGVAPSRPHRSGPRAGPGRRTPCARGAWGGEPAGGWASDEVRALIQALGVVLSPFCGPTSARAAAFFLPGGAEKGYADTLSCSRRNRRRASALIKSPTRSFDAATGAAVIHLGKRKQPSKNKGWHRRLC